MLRVITATVPESDGAALRSLLEDQELIANWQHSLLDGLFYVHLLVRDDRAELLLDLLEQRFGTSEQFRAVILRVHATVPALEEEGEEREEQAPPPGRVARAEIQSELESGIDVGPIFLTTVILSAVIAAVGLFRNNVAVIIGAMVVAPLLKPMMAIAFALTVGDLVLARRGIRSALLGAGLGFLFSSLLGWGYRGEPGPEILARTEPDWTDLVLALAGGAAGALAFTSGVSASLVGVMVAVALLPPLVVAGLLTGRADWSGASGAALSLATTAVSVILAGMFVFAWRGVRPRTWWEKEKARRYFRRSVAVVTALTLALLGLLLVQARL